MTEQQAFLVCQQEHEEDYNAIMLRIAALMRWPKSKATKWMSEPNPFLGEISPCSMIAHGRLARLDKFVQAAEEAVSENKQD